MSRDESSPEPSAIPTSPAAPAASESALPPAWQPLTPRGVASFATARMGRLVVVQALLALAAAGVFLWFLHEAWFPIVRAAIRGLPETGYLQDGQLSSPRTSIDPLAGDNFLAFIVDIDGVGTPSLATDLRIEFHRQNVAFCSFLGCLPVRYPKDWNLHFNRPELESWWGAWLPMIYGMAGLGVVAILFFSWIVLATLYCPVVRAYAYFRDRRLTLAGSWKLSAAALLPGALLCVIALALYSVGLLDLIRTLVCWLLHWAVAWGFLLVAPLRLPRVSDALPPPRHNPFGTGQPKRSNPFVPS